MISEVLSSLARRPFFEISDALSTLQSIFELSAKADTPGEAGMYHTNAGLAKRTSLY